MDPINSKLQQSSDDRASRYAKQAGRWRALARLLADDCERILNDSDTNIHPALIKSLTSSIQAVKDTDSGKWPIE